MGGDPARRLSQEEAALFERVGYEVRENMNGGHIVRPGYGINWRGVDAELGFIERVGEERAVLLDATARLAGTVAGVALRARFDAGDYSLEIPLEAETKTGGRRRR